MDTVSSILALKALDGLSMRAEATAQNIANAGTQTYRPLSVNFEAALARAARAGPAAVAAVQPQVERVLTTPGADQSVRLDLEMATASATQLRYSALIEVLSRQMMLQDLVISGTR